MKILIKNGILVNEEVVKEGSILIDGNIIEEILEPGEATDKAAAGARIVDCRGAYILPGLIDDQVHFREPGLTHKGEISTESRAAAAGGITSYMEMPNTLPNTLTRELLEKKYERAAEASAVNYSFFMGASNENLSEVLKTDPSNVCGVKVFMGASTGNMLVDDRKVLDGIFSECGMLIATHCEDESIIRKNIEAATKKYGEEIPVTMHPWIRNEEACYRSSALAVELASKYGTRLHVLHISTKKETSLFEKGPVDGKRITAEACIHHLWFTEADYPLKGNFIKWNPAVKSAADREGIWEALLEGRIDVLATDHAPHTLEEKSQSYKKAPSGGPLVQHALPALMDCVHEGRIRIQDVVRKYCHNPASAFRVSKRGFLRPGYFADLVVVDPDSPWEVRKENILYKCGWSPFEGHRFRSKVVYTFVNGKEMYNNSGRKDLGSLSESFASMRLTFE